jgi:hypothetical protein
MSESCWSFSATSIRLFPSPFKSLLTSQAHYHTESWLSMISDLCLWPIRVTQDGSSVCLRASCDYTSRPLKPGSLLCSSLNFTLQQYPEVTVVFWTYHDLFLWLLCGICFSSPNFFSRLIISYPLKLSSGVTSLRHPFRRTSVWICAVSVFSQHKQTLTIKTYHQPLVSILHMEILLHSSL